MATEIDTVAFGKSDIRVSRVGLGGEGILRTTGKADAARQMIEAALDEGITYFDPAILSRAVTRWPVDAVMMPVNPVEGVLGGFLDDTLPKAQEKGLAVIGMKILGAGHYVQPRVGVTATMLIRYAMSKGITVAIVGCSAASEVATLAATGRRFKPLSRAHAGQLEILFEPLATKYAFYRGVI